MKKCQDSIRAGRFSDSADLETLQLLTVRQNAAARSMGREIIGNSS